LALLLAAGSLRDVRAGDPAGGYYENERWGFKVRTPKDWINAHLSADEEWIASKHLGKRELEDARSEYWTREAPEMWVIGFPHIRLDQRAAKRTEKEGGEKEVEFETPYRDYKDFIKRNKDFLTWERGGYYFSKEDETKIRGVKVTQYEIKMEKMVNSPRRVVCWVFHFDDIDFAVQFKILEGHYEDYESTFRTCLKSFKRIERKKALPGSATTGSKIVDIDNIDKLPPEERKKALKDAVERKFQRELDALPDDWKHRESKHFLVLYNAPEKFVRATIKHAEAVRDHLVDTFGEVGRDYVPPGIIRIFATDNERDAFNAGTRSVWDVVKEVSIAAGHGWEKDMAYESLNRSLFYQYLHYRNRLLWTNMPSWLSTGLDKYVGMIRTRGRSIKFSNEDWTRDSMRLSIKKGEVVPLKDLMSAGITNVDDQAANTDWNKYEQARSVVYWLMKEGNRGRYKGLVSKYIDALTLTVEEAEAEYQKRKAELDALAEDAAQEQNRSMDENDEGEDGEDTFDAEAYNEELMKALTEKHKEILAKSFERTFGEWSDRDWERFDRAWRSFAE
jgi:hypothetical protein